MGPVSVLVLVLVSVSLSLSLSLPTISYLMHVVPYAGHTKKMYLFRKKNINKGKRNPEKNNCARPVSEETTAWMR